ncbi:MAG: hypothetical protein HY814_04475 [Candidatus Riflebacteria bacterium]|nr:hypothetical protein [Candidatus Riflebacteria bacterium]
MRSRAPMRPWSGMKFLIPSTPYLPLPSAVIDGITTRGGSLAGPEGPVDVVVLPEDADLGRVRHSAAARWIGEGALIMWEGAFLRALHARP